MTSVFELSDKISAARSKIVIITESNNTPEQRRIMISTVELALDAEISKAVEQNVGGVVMAIKGLENLSKAHEESIRHLCNKIYECKNYIDRLKQSTLKRMQNEGVNTLSERDFLICSADNNKVIVR